MRMKLTFLVTAVLAAGVIAQPARSQVSRDKGGEDETGPYEPVSGFPQPIAPAGFTWGSQAGVFAETPNRIFLANRGELLLPAITPPGYNGFFGTIDIKQTNNGASRRETPPDVMRDCIVVVDGTGKMLEDWTQWDHLFAGGGTAALGRGPHAIRISPYDPEHRIWVVDDVRQAIFVFSNDGKKLLMTIGEPGVPGNDDKHFGRPTDIAWNKDGSFFVSDGYVNTRVVKFDKDGKYLMTWGVPDADRKSPKPNEFSGVHGIATDANGRVYVSDRGNQRVQVFDSNGKFLDQWPGISPWALYMSNDQHLWIADGATDKFLEFDLNGKFLYGWGTHGTGPGQFWAVHGFSVDTDGNMYAAETYGGRTQKFRPRAGADRSKLMGAPVPLMPKSGS